MRRTAIVSLILVVLSASSLAQSGTPSLDASSIFLEAPIYGSGGNYAQAIAVGDVNGDGKLDLVVVNSACLAVLLGNGDGTFQPPLINGSAGGAPALALADVNGDGKLDIVVAGGNVSVGVLLGNGDGTFQAAQFYSSGGTGAVSVAVADMNGDGKLDLVVANNAGGPGIDGSIGVLLGNGDGTFQAPHTFDSGGFETASVVVADVNGDGKPDALAVSACTDYPVTTNCGLGGVLDVLMGNGDGTFQPAQNDIFGSDAPRSIAVGDVNEDGKLDLVVASSAACNNTITCIGPAVTILLGNGDGTFRTAQSYSSGGFLGSSEALAIADVNGDGKPDLIVANADSISINSYTVNGDVSVLLGNGDGTFQPAQSYSSGAYNATAVAVGDVNGDGKTDVLVANNCIIQDCSLTGAVGVLLGNGDGTLRAALTYPSGGWIPYVIAVGDVNADGKSDLVVGNRCANINTCPGGGVGVLLGNGDGRFQTPQSYNAGAYPASSIAVADVNGDGKPDMLVANPCPDATCGSTSNKNGVVLVLLNNGDGTFQSAQDYNSGAPIAEAVAVGDVNGDGKPDIVVTNAATDYEYTDCGDFSFCYQPTGPPTIGVLLGNGDGTFQAAQIYTLSPGSPLSVVIADVNGDGKPDVLVANDTAPATVDVLLGNGNGTFHAVQTYSSGYESNSIAVGDLNGDGRPDIVVGNNCGGLNGNGDSCVGDGAVGVLLGNGDGTFQPVLLTMMPGQPAFPGTQMGQIGLADYNGDGYLDVATAGFLLLGKNNGAFQTPIYLGAGGSAGTAVGDFNGDGKPDLAVGAVTILLNIVQRTPVATNTTLTSSGNPVGVNQAVTFTAGVTGRGWTPTGTVSYKIGSSTLSTVPLVNGYSTYTTAFPSIETQSITAVYSGDANNLGSTSSTLNEVVLAATSTNLTTSNSSTVVDQPVTFTASVTSPTGTPTGNVTFTVSGNKPVNVLLTNGEAMFTWTFANAGVRTVTAAYSGNANDAPSTSAPLIETVSPVVVTIAGSPEQPLTVNSAGDYVAQVTITNAGNVTVSSVQVTIAGTTLGSGALTSGPAAVTNLAPGASATVTLEFPPNSVPSGTTNASLKVSSTYSVTSPSLNGNWALSFRSVNL